MILARLLAVAAGVWLMAAPAVLGYADDPAASFDRVVGPVAAAAAFIAIWEVTRPLRWVTVPLGAWLVVAPWLLGFPVEAAISDLVTGAALVATGLVRGELHERFGGGWSSLTGRMPDREAVGERPQAPPR